MTRQAPVRGPSLQCSRAVRVRTLESVTGSGTRVDLGARPEWHQTTDEDFPFAAGVDRQWWVLRFNISFPEHDLYTLFIDGQAVADITGDPASDVPLIASMPSWSSPATPTLDAQAARGVVAAVAQFVDYGSEFGDPCVLCSRNPG